MLPPNQPFFKFHIDAADLKSIATGSGQDPKTFEGEVTRGLSMTEQLLVDYNEKNGDRICLGEAMKHLYIAGNVFLVHIPKIGLKYYPLSRYVVHRDYCGNVLKAITTETIGFYALPKEIQGQVLEQLKIKEKSDTIPKLEEKELTLYATEKLSQIKGLKLVGTAKDKGGVFSFVVDKIHPQDLAFILNKEGVSVRVGHHCAAPLVRRMGHESVVRASLGLYNTKGDIDILCQAINKAKTLF
jgi:hypothetical protein